MIRGRGGGGVVGALLFLSHLSAWASLLLTSESLHVITTLSNYELGRGYNLRRAVRISSYIFIKKIIMYTR